MLLNGTDKNSEDIRLDKDLIKPYEEIINLFKKTGEYVGGADGLFNVMQQHGHQYIQGCDSCKAGLLLTAWKILNAEYVN